MSKKECHLHKHDKEQEKMWYRHKMAHTKDSKPRKPCDYCKLAR